MSTPPYIPSPHPYGGEGYGKRVLSPIGPYAKIKQKATKDQKRRKIDTVDFYFENQLGSI